MTVAAVATVAATRKNGGFLRVTANCRTGVAPKAATLLSMATILSTAPISPHFENGGFLGVSASAQPEASWLRSREGEGGQPPPLAAVGGCPPRQPFWRWQMQWFCDERG